MKTFILRLLESRLWGGLAGKIFSFLHDRPNIAGLSNPFHVSHYFVERNGARYLAPAGTYLATGSRNDEIVKFSAKAYEPEIAYLIKSLIKPGDVVLDIGANVGLHTVNFARATGPEGHVYAFEPVARMAERNSLNCALNGLANVTIVDCALGDENGAVAMNVNTSDGGMEGTSSLLETVHVEKRPQHYETQEVRIRRLDDLIEELGPLSRLDFIKMDTEGFEPMVLKGAMETLRRHRPAMIIEAHSTRLAKVGLSFQWYLDTFPDYHVLIVYPLTPANPYFRLVPLSEEPPEICVNLLLLPRTKTHVTT